MRVVKNFHRSIVLSAVCATLAAVTPAFAADMKTGEISALMAKSADNDITSIVTVSATESFTIGYLTPSNRSVAFGVLPGESLAANTLNGQAGGFTLTDTLDFSSTFTADLEGKRIGLYGGFADRPSTLSLEPGTAWNFGASVGYGGFYLRGGISDASALGLVQNRQGWEAGFGYETGNLDLRLTYAASQSDVGLGIVEQQIDSKQWTIGGNYQITPRLRLNADAFYDMQDNHSPAFASPTTLTPPQGTGARLGVQLRF